jgi:hypothetical protein
MLKSIKFCPRCKSLNISIDSTNPLVGSDGVPPSYICNDCEYMNKIIPEIGEKDIEKFVKKKPKFKEIKHNKVDISFGIFEVRVIWKIIGPLIIFLYFLNSILEYINLIIYMLCPEFDFKTKK